MSILMLCNFSHLFLTQATPTSLSFRTTQLTLLLPRLSQNSMSLNRMLRFWPSYQLAHQRYLNILAPPNASVDFVHLACTRAPSCSFTVSTASSFYLLSLLRVEMLQGSVLCPGSFLSPCTPHDLS